MSSRSYQTIKDREKEFDRVREIRKEIGWHLENVFNIKGELYREWVLFNQNRCDFDTFICENRVKLENAYHILEVLGRNPLIVKYQYTETKNLC